MELFVVVSLLCVCVVWKPAADCGSGRCGWLLQRVGRRATRDTRGSFQACTNGEVESVSSPLVKGDQAGSRVFSRIVVVWGKYAESGSSVPRKMGYN